MFIILPQTIELFKVFWKAVENCKKKRKRKGKSPLCPRLFLPLLKSVRRGQGLWQIGVAQGIGNGLWGNIPLGHHFKSGVLLIKDIAHSVICIFKVYKLLWASWLMTWIKLIVKRNVCPWMTLLKPEVRDYFSVE